ncbi:hypothetical protein Sste5346_009894 [Sporothrix stenoceras]|uniref:Zn(2)-C6 fungal-type domain-containing protein n=1 Tax=Sporothrix stenoceras TaxID=5173 RepID=A0ABR3YHZ7_9PEZI
MESGNNVAVPGSVPASGPVSVSVPASGASGNAGASTGPLSGPSGPPTQDTDRDAHRGTSPMPPATGIESTPARHPTSTVDTSFDTETPSQTPSQHGPITSTTSARKRASASGGIRKPGGKGPSGKGPGRKPRACAECKKQKMKCEVLAGQVRCRHCHRRGLECVMGEWARELQEEEREREREAKEKNDHPDRQDPSRDDDDSSWTHGNGRDTQTLDEMRREIQQMKASIDILVRHGLQTRPSTLPVPVPLPDTPQATNTQGSNHGTHSSTHATSVPMVTHSTTHSAAQTVTQTISPAATSLSTREDNTHMAMTRENSLEPEPTDDNTAGGGAVAVDEPMGSLYEVTRLRNIRSSGAKMIRPPRDGPDDALDDFISKGVISEAEAEALYQTFHTTLNHYLWVGLEQTHPSFASVRKSSELLTATILTVTALHIPTSAATFDTCYREFLSLISSSMFSRYHSVDDVRGLCIAAFWLSEVSWKLSGHAIRIATELNIHQSFARALEGDGDREHFLKARLWYMLYVCDHHFSIAYGRPPMIAESQQIREHETFLASPFADALDQRICSQVNLMQIMTRIYGRFSERRIPSKPPSHPALHPADDDMPVGGPATAMLAESDLGELRTFNLEIDQWRMRWHARQANSRYIGTFPPKGIILYSYFAKLQLNSLAVRGVSLRDGDHLSTERKEFANMGISAAASILTFVLEEDDLRRALVGTPLYVHTMIAFASVFLMKMAAQWNRVMGLNVESAYVAHLLRRMVALLQSAVTSDRHLLYHIAAGLEKMLAKLQLGTGSNTASNNSSNNNSGSSSSAASSLGDQIQNNPNPQQIPMHPQQAHHAHQRSLELHSVEHDQSMTSSHDFSMNDGSHHGHNQTQHALFQQHHQHQHQHDMMPPPNDAGLVSAFQGPQVPVPRWDTDLAGGLGGQDVFGDGMPILNNTIIYEAFGSESANDVYNLLTSQFSY